MFDRDLVARARRTKQSGMLKHAGSFAYVLFVGPVSMRAIVRSGTELFTSTVAKQASGFDVVINGNLFNATNTAKFSALIGGNPVSASATTAKGRVARAGTRAIGSSEPERFYIAEIAEPGIGRRPGRLRYVTGYGDPPEGGSTVTAMGGVGPLVSAGLSYGQGNLYRAGTSGPQTGEPGKARANLVQRNNLTFVDADAKTRSLTTGKTIVAYHSREQALLVGVQADGAAPGQSYAAIRNGLVMAGFSDAVFLDGSDSAMLWYRGKCVVAPGENKNQLMTVGLGFRARPHR